MSWQSPDWSQLAGYECQDRPVSSPPCTPPDVGYIFTSELNSSWGRSGQNLEFIDISPGRLCPKAAWQTACPPPKDGPSSWSRCPSRLAHSRLGSCLLGRLEGDKSFRSLRPRLWSTSSPPTGRTSLSARATLLRLANSVQWLKVTFCVWRIN